jgi:glycosyltransferase involved in cell wall biosynthesis
MPAPTTLVLLPTIDERPNLETLIPAVLQALPDALLLVVDDGSRDGTPELAEAFGRDTGRVETLRRERRLGYGSACRAGFRFALERPSIQQIVQMDADGSHQPRHLRAIAGGDAELVIGSRYVPGGGVEGWAAHRRALSRFAGAYARALTGVPVADPTSGYRCFRRRALEAIDPGSIRSDGYAFLVETAFRTWRAGFRIAETPIVFVERAHGASKLNLGIAWDSAWRCAALRFERPGRAAARGAAAPDRG